MLGRTMHDLAFDAIHDEIVVTGPLAQAHPDVPGSGQRRGSASSRHPGR